MIIDYKRIDLFGEMLFERAVIKPPFRKPNPLNGEACFLHVREGEYNSFSEEAFLQISKKQSVLMKCGMYVGEMVPDRTTGMYEAIAVHFFPEVLKKIYANELPSFLVNKKRPLGTSMALVHASKAIEKYVEDVVFYFDHPQLLNEDILSIKVKEIILLLMHTQDASNVLQILESLFTERTIDFKTIIEAHIFSDLSQPELAVLTNMSLSSFKRKFKSVYQTNPSSYIQQRRLEKSKELLIVSDQGIGAIAYDCGFKTISHFSKKFKEKFGLPPTEFRMNHSEQ